MAITIITGVPGAGKTALIVSMLEEEAKKGRHIFVNNIPGLLIPHYRAGRITDWQAGTWLHIDSYRRPEHGLAVRLSRVVAEPEVKRPTKSAWEYVDDESEDDDDGNENWIANPNVFKDEHGKLKINVRDEYGDVVDVQDYESHKGCILVIDECQNYFRPRPAGSPVPDHVAALEVHRKQLDIWLVTQRIMLIDSNVRGLCSKHIALRSTALGRYKYEWPECGDVDSKSSRDVASSSRFKLPKHVFSLYKSAEVHTKHSHKLPFAAKAAIVLFPLCAFLIFNMFSLIRGKYKKPESQPPAAVSSASSEQQIQQAPQSSLSAPLVKTSLVSDQWKLIGSYKTPLVQYVMLRSASGAVRQLPYPLDVNLQHNAGITLPEGGYATEFGGTMFGRDQQQQQQGRGHP